jgi:peptidoglycan-associated lipoprotein
MKKHASVIVVAAMAALMLTTGFLAPVKADARRFRAFVFPDRNRPEVSVVVDDFRINETVWDEGGVQYVWVYGPAGNFQLFFNRIRQIEFQEYLGPNTTKVDWAWFRVHVSGVYENEAWNGRMEVRVMRGIAEGVPWYYFPLMQPDRGIKTWRIVFGDEAVPPTEPPSVLASTEVAGIMNAPGGVKVVTAGEEPTGAAAAAGAAGAGLPTEDDLFARMSLDELNAQTPLGDVFFDFDKADLRPDGEQQLQRNTAWLRRWPSVKVRIDGMADPRGTNEYNLTLGRQRAEVVRDYLIAQGLDATRFDVRSAGEENLVCTEQTEACWARNRRGRFWITAK